MDSASFDSLDPAEGRSFNDGGGTDEVEQAQALLSRASDRTAGPDAEGSQQDEPRGQRETGLPPGFDLRRYRPEDGGLMDAFVDLHGVEWCYVVGYERWYRWTGTHWAKDERRELERQILDLVDTLNRLARDTLFRLMQLLVDITSALGVAGIKRNAQLLFAIGDAIEFLEDFVRATKRNIGRVHSIAQMARLKLVVIPGQLDPGNLLNLANGTLDLDTLLFHPHRAEDHLTYMLEYAYDPAAECPRWRQFLAEVLVKLDPEENGYEADVELARLFQELVGYSATSDTKHEVMVWQVGEGANGKTTANTVLQQLLGPLALAVDFNALGKWGNYDLARLPGRRVVFSTEGQRGGTIAEGLIKRIVSGELTPARPIFGRPFDFHPVATIWWSMNDKPVISDTSDGIWRRMKLIEFRRKFREPEQDPDLAKKLVLELPGILNWAIEGLRRLRERGRFTDALAVREAVTVYRAESNSLAEWLVNRTQRTQTPGTPADLLFNDYRNWCRDYGDEPLRLTGWGQEMKRLGVVHKRDAGGIRYAVTLRSMMAAD